MPAVSKKQRKFMGAELGRKRKGEATETGMSEGQLHDFAATKEKGLPEKVRKKKPRHGSETMRYVGRSEK